MTAVRRFSMLPPKTAIKISTYPIDPQPFFIPLEMH